MGKMLEDMTKSGKTRLGTVHERAEHALAIAKRVMGPVHEENEEGPRTAKEGSASAGELPAPSRTRSALAVGDTLERLTDMVSVLSTVAKGIGMAVVIVRTASTLVRTVQTLAPGRRSWSGDRDSTLGSMAILGAGALVGAGAAVALIAATESDLTLAQRLEIAK